MPRTILLGIAMLVVAGTGFVPTAEALAQAAPANSAAVPATPSSSPTTTVPARGLVMSQVEERFGVPDTKLAPVGDPPITRWVYKDFTVYFEGRYVIHSVLNQ